MRPCTRARWPRARGGRAGTAWSFDTAEDRWWHAQLAKLVEGLKALADERTGLLSTGTAPGHGWGIPRRLELVREVNERSLDSPEARARWDDALASIPDECPWYARVSLTPQFGLCQGTGYQRA